MPVSGRDVGLNVWVENDELMFYMGRAGCRDENGALLKPGRVRVKFTLNLLVFFSEKEAEIQYILVAAVKDE